MPQKAGHGNYFGEQTPNKGKRGWLRRDSWVQLARNGKIYFQANSGGDQKKWKEITTGETGIPVSPFCFSGVSF
jgi:hypothetical protein